MGKILWRKSFCWASPCWQSFLPITTTGQVRAVKKPNRGDALCPFVLQLQSEQTQNLSVIPAAPGLPKSTFRPSDDRWAHLASGQETRGWGGVGGLWHGAELPTILDPHPPPLSWEGMQCGGEPVLSLAVNGSSLPWPSLQRWWCSWGSVQTPPGSSAPPLLTADESVRPFWPVPVDTRMSLPAPPLWQTYTVTWGGGETEAAVSNYGRREGSSTVLSARVEISVPIPSSSTRDNRRSSGEQIRDLWRQFGLGCRLLLHSHFCRVG